MASQQATPHEQGALGPPPGPPYAPQTQSLGGVPSIIPDVLISAILLVVFIIGALCHVAIFKLNRKKGHKFFLSMMVFGFCMCRIVTMALRIAWATEQRNVKLAIAANIFVQAGTILLYVINLVFAQRIIRAQHPRLGWHRALSVAGRLLIIAIILTLVALIISVVQSSYTLNANTHRIDRDIQLYGTTFYAAIAFLPISMVVIGLIIPRRIRTEKFGEGRFRYKIAILLVATAMCTIRGAYGAAIAWQPMIPLQSPDHPWYYSKAAFYTFDFIPEIIVVALYALVRVDRRFHVPSGQRGSYVVAPSDTTFGNIFQNREAAQSEVLKVYSEEELFDDSATLADTLRYSQTSLMLDSASGKWALKRMSAQSLYSRDSMTPSRMSDYRDTPSRLAEPERDAPSRLSGRESTAASTWSYV